MAPRMTNDELIAAEEAKLAEIRAKAEEKVQAQIAKTQARLAELQAKAEERQTTRLAKLDELIEGAQTRLAKAQAYLDKLTLERDELVDDGAQPELIDDDRTEQPEPELETAGKGSRRAKPDAA